MERDKRDGGEVFAKAGSKTRKLIINGNEKFKK
jgi:hypothetical protein